MLKTLSEKFDRMSPYEVSSAVNSFAKIGIFQEDVFTLSIQRINALAKGELPNIKHASKGRFSQIGGPIFLALCNGQLQETEAFKEFVSDDYQNASFMNRTKDNLTIHNNILSDRQHAQEYLVAILSTKLDESDPKFKETAIKIVEHLN